MQPTAAVGPWGPAARHARGAGGPGTRAGRGPARIPRHSRSRATAPISAPRRRPPSGPGEPWAALGPLLANHASGFERAGRAASCKADGRFSVPCPANVGRAMREFPGRIVGPGRPEPSGSRGVVAHGAAGAHGGPIETIPDAQVPGPHAARLSTLGGWLLGPGSLPRMARRGALGSGLVLGADGCGDEMAGRTSSRHRRAVARRGRVVCSRRMGWRAGAARARWMSARRSRRRVRRRRRAGRAGVRSATRRRRPRRSGRSAPGRAMRGAMERGRHSARQRRWPRALSACGLLARPRRMPGPASRAEAGMGVSWRSAPPGPKPGGVARGSTTRWRLRGRAARGPRGSGRPWSRARSPPSAGIDAPSIEARPQSGASASAGRPRAPAGHGTASARPRAPAARGAAAPPPPPTRAPLTAHDPAEPNRSRRALSGLVRVPGPDGGRAAVPGSGLPPPASAAALARPASGRLRSPSTSRLSSTLSRTPSRPSASTRPRPPKTRRPRIFGPGEEVSRSGRSTRSCA